MTAGRFVRIIVPPKALTDAVAFVLAECGRIQDVLRRDGPRALSDDDRWFSIPAPNGFGGLLYGRAAQNSIEMLAQEAGRKVGISRRVSAETIVRALKPELTKRFIKERRPVDDREVQRFISAVGEAAQQQCEDRRHLVPCHLMHSSELDELRIGPITFHNYVQFRRLVAPRARAYLSVTGGHKPLKRRLLQQSLKFYKQFKWIAEVEILRCDQITSEAVAENAAISAIDCLHLVFGVYNSRKMRVGGPALSTDRRAKLGLLPEGNLTVEVSAAWPGHVEYSEGWSVFLEEGETAQIIRLCGVALEAAINPDLNRPLSWRFLDAARWFGEAAREESPSTAVVKYATALERLVMTEERGDISSIFAVRFRGALRRPGQCALQA